MLAVRPVSMFASVFFSAIAGILVATVVLHSDPGDLDLSPYPGPGTLKKLSPRA